MKIKTKLILNSVVILVLMAVVGVAAVVGIKHIQQNIFLLTQKSTPYQIKTLNYQRAVQAHASNLLKVAASDTINDFRQNSTNADASLAENIKSAEELVKLGSTSDYDTTTIADNTKSIIAITEKRLNLQGETQAAITSMRGRLEDASKRLNSLDGSVRKLQQGAAGNMVTNIDTTSVGNQQANYLATIRDGLKDLNLSLNRIPVTADKRSVAGLKSGIEATAATCVQTVKNIKWSDKKAGDELARKIRDIGAKLAEAAALRMKFINDEDESDNAKSQKIAKDMEYEISYILPGVIKDLDKAGESLKVSTGEMSKSVSAFSETNNILIQSSAILLLSVFIDSQINYSLSIKSVTDFDKSAAAIEHAFTQIDGTTQKLKGTLAKGKLKNEAKLLNDSLAALSTVRQGFLGKAGAADKIRGSLAIIDEVTKLNLKMKEMVSRQMIQSGKDVATAQSSQESAVSSVKAAVNTTVMLIIVIVVIALLVSILLGKWISTSITSPIRELTTVAEGFGNGDFSIRMDEARKDEFGTLASHFNQATAKLGEITTQLKDSIDKLTLSSQKLSKTADNLDDGAKAQASQTEQSVTAMTEVSQTVMEVAKNARDAAATSKDALNMATTGSVVVTKTVRGMHEIADSVKGAAATIGKLSESSDKIGAIVNTINDIADQTNLLALNASIEAARAGEQGRGFAVVADAVRILAHRTAEATHEIAAIISEIQAGTEKSVSAMKTGEIRVEEGVRLSGEASNSLEAIVKASQLGMDMAQMIATATDDQSTASAEVSHGMEKIANITHDLNRSTKEIKEASEELSGLANELNRMALWFKV